MTNIDTKIAKMSPRSLSKNLVYSALSQGSVFIFSFVYYALISRELGPLDMGKFSTYMLVPMIVARFGHLGFDAANMYYITKPEVARGHLFANSALLTAIVTVICAILVLVYSWIDGGIFLGNNILGVALVALVSLSIFRTLFHSVMVGENRLRIYSLIAAVDAFLPLFASVILWLFDSLTIFNLVLVNVIALGCTALLIFIRLIETNFAPKLDLKLAVASFKYGWKSWINNLANQLIYKSDVFLLAYFLEPAQVGIYVVAVLVIEKAWYFSGAICNAIFPLVGGGTMQEGARIAVRVARVNFWFVIVSSAVIFFSADWLVQLVFSSAYLAAVYPMMLLIPGVIFLSIPKILVSHLAAIDKLEYAIVASVTALVFNLILNVVMIPPLGVPGAAIASSIAYFIYMVIYLVGYSKLTGTPLIQYFKFEWKMSRGSND